MQGKVFLVGIFFQTSLNLFICDMRKWKKNKNIRRRVLFLRTLSQFLNLEKNCPHTEPLLILGSLRVFLQFAWHSGDCRQWTTRKTGRKVFQLSGKVVFHPLRNLILEKETKYNLETSQVIAPYLLQTFFKNLIFNLTLLTIFHLLTTF